MEIFLYLIWFPDRICPSRALLENSDSMLNTLVQSTQRVIVLNDTIWFWVLIKIKNNRRIEFDQNLNTRKNYKKLKKKTIIVFFIFYMYKLRKKSLNKILQSCFFFRPLRWTKFNKEKKKYIKQKRRLLKNIIDYNRGVQDCRKNVPFFYISFTQ